MFGATLAIGPVIHCIIIDISQGSTRKNGSHLLSLKKMGGVQYRTIFLADLAIIFMASLLKQSLSMGPIGKIGQKGTAEGPQSCPCSDSPCYEVCEETANEQDEVSWNHDKSVHHHASTYTGEPVI